MNKLLLILVCFYGYAANAQSKFYTSLATGISFHSIKNKEDAKTSDFVLHQEAYRFKKHKFSPTFQLQLGYLLNKHFGVELSPSSIYLTTSWWGYDIENKNCNRDLVLNNYIFPLSINYRNKLSPRFNFKVYAGGFIDYIPKYTYLTDYSNLNSNVPDRSSSEHILTLNGLSIQGSDLAVYVVYDFEIDKPLITKIQFGYTGALQLGYNISSSLNLFFQLQVFKTITDLENKKDITMTRFYRDGKQNDTTFNYFSNMYKQFYSRDANDINNRPKSTVTMLNVLIGFRYNFRNRKNRNWIFHEEPRW